LDDDLLDDDLLLEDDLELNEYESTETLATDLGESTDPSLDMNFDVHEEDPDEVSFDVSDEFEEDELEEDDEKEEDEDDEYELDEDEAPGLKDKILGLLTSFSKLGKKTEEKSAKNVVSKNKVEEEDDEDAEDDDYLDDEEDNGAELSFKEKMEKTVQTAINQKIPLLKNLLNKNKGKTTAVDAEGNELEELELTENAQVPVRKKIKINPVTIIILACIIIYFFVDDPVETEPVKNETSTVKRTPIKKEPVAELPSEEPVAEVPSEEPVAEVPSEEPVAEVPSEEPTTELEDKLQKVEDNAKVNLDDIKSDKVPEDMPSTETPVVETPKEEEVPKKVENVADTDLDDINLNSTDSNQTVTDSTEMSETPLEPLEPIEDTKVVEQTPTMEEPPLSEDTSLPTEEVVNIDEPKEVIPAKPEEIIPQKELQPDISSEITKKLLQDLEVRLKEEKLVQKTMSVVKPTTAPSYEIAGRGLSYNCRDKHWACIEQEEYNKCRQNFSWNKNEGIPLECYPVAFLKTEYDCAMVQQEKIDSVSETDFCEE